MSDSLFSPSWYRVANLTPRLRDHVQIHRHDYRGQVWYLLQDLATGRAHRFSPGAHALIGMFDGKRTLDEIWHQAVELMGDDAPSQDEALGLLAQLHGVDALQTNLPPDSAELLRRAEKQAKQKVASRMRSPLAIRIPLWDPDRFLVATLPWVAPLFSRWAMVLWVLLVGYAGFTAAQHWEALTENLSDRVLSAQNLVLLYFIYPIVKGIHELAHGYAIRRWGGEVHELGIMLLVFMPVPYVDASASSAFRPKHQRMVVAGAGIMTELTLAAIAMLLWTVIEPGVVRTIAYNVMLIGGVSTVLFNGNPLLRFDGYYVLADGVEIPNLAPRSNGYLGYLFRRWVFGQREAVSPVRAPGEPAWFVSYGLAAMIYRLFILSAIVLFVASQFFFVGVLLALWAVYTGVFSPVFTTLGKLLTDPGLNRRPGRTRVALAAIAGVLVCIVFLLPLPFGGRAEGVIWIPEDAHVRAGVDGFVAEVSVLGGDPVAAGTTVLRLTDPVLRARASVLQARVRELEHRVDAELFQDRVAADLSRAELEATRLDLADVERRLDQLQVRAARSGRIVVPEAGDLPGRFVTQGQLVAYVAESPVPTIRVTVPQEDAALVARRLQGVEVVIADTDFEVLPARLSRLVPGGTDRLAHPALGSGGGGRIAVEPGDETGRTTLERVFELDLVLREPAPLRIGQRVHVRFDFGSDSLFNQLWRALRQLFLRQFGI